MKKCALIGLSATILLTGCGREEIRVYEIPKEAEDVSSPFLQAPVQQQEALAWKTPEGWQEQQADGMRKASFSVETKEGPRLDVSVVSLGGAAGGLLSNVNRWRNQVGLKPITQESLQGNLKSLPIGDAQGSLVTIYGEEKTLEGKYAAGILAAILERQGKTWFFKMMGPVPGLRHEKKHFEAFLASVQWTSKSSNRGGVSWHAPKHWEAKPASAMRRASYGVTKDGREVDISVVSLPGMAGGILANINRWRGQVKLAPWTEEELNQSAQKLTLHGTMLTVVDFVSEEKIINSQYRKRILAAVLITEGQTWFFKAIGEETLVGEEKQPFLEMLQKLEF